MSIEPASTKLSVVIAASNNLEALEKTLTSLRDQASGANIEVIAVTNFNGETELRLKQRFPFAKCATLPRDATVPVLRTRGINLSHGDIVALIEDYGFADENWCAEIKKAHDSGHSIVGGAVENRSPDRLLNWAVYFFDYGRFMLPMRPEFTPSLSGINASYNRRVLEEVAELYRDGFEEAFVHDELKKRGHELSLVPSAIIYLSKNFEFRTTFQDFYHLARSFAVRRVARREWTERIVFAIGACLLPILLSVRVVIRIVPKRRHLSKLLLSLPHLVVLMVSWSAGEFCGYVSG
jgi:glycosyltransferase involved in cell wall biosynthesis